jgi:hypothetical protein
MDSVIYTDGHGTRVTDHEFVTGDSTYSIEGIIDARINQVERAKLPAIFCMLIGLVLAGLGFMRRLDERELNMGSFSITPNMLAIVAGIILVLAAILMLSRNRKYAVHITTAEGEREPIISTRKDYIRQIVEALNNARMHVRESLDYDEGLPTQAHP